MYTDGNRMQRLVSSAFYISNTEKQKTKATLLKLLTQL